MNELKALRTHLVELLDGGSAHIRVADALANFPLESINDRPASSPHSAWELLEHIRLAQWDILEFSTNPNYKEMNFPGDYWPKAEGTPESWEESIKRTLDDLQSMRELVAEEQTDLLAKIPHGSGQTILREAMLVADHNAYHVGQLILLKRILQTRAS